MGDGKGALFGDAAQLDKNLSALWSGFKTKARDVLHTLAGNAQAREVLHELEDFAVHSLFLSLAAEADRRGLGGAPAIVQAGVRTLEGSAEDGIKNALHKATDGQ